LTGLGSILSWSSIDSKRPHRRCIADMARTLGWSSL